MAENPDQGDSLPTELEDTTALHEIAVEAHELYLELSKVGFPERVLSQIMAHMLYDALTAPSFSVEIEEDDDEDDDPDNERSS